MKQLIFSKPKTMELSEHPQYVRNGFYKNILYLVLIVGCSIAAFMTIRTLMTAVYALIICLVYAFVVVHEYFILTRGEALVLDGRCVDIIEGTALLSKKTSLSKIIIKSLDNNNDTTYAIPYRKQYHCNMDDEVSLYTVSSAMYVDSNDYVIINRPLFIKITKK